MPRTTLVILVALLLGARPAHAQQEQQIELTASPTNVRGGRSIAAPIVAVLAKGTVLPVLDADGSWYRVALSPELGVAVTEGYVHRSVSRVLPSEAGDPAAPRPMAASAPQTRFDEARLPARAIAPTASYRDPTIALVIGLLVPGGGQFYTGETGRGALYLGISVGAPLLGEMVSASTCNDYVGTCSLTPMYLGVAAALASWIYGAVKAQSSAEAMNQRHGYPSREGLRWTPTVEHLGSTGQVAMGIRLTTSR